MRPAELLVPCRFQEDGHAGAAQDAEQPAASFDALQLTRVIGSRHPGLPIAQPAGPHVAAEEGPGRLPSICIMRSVSHVSSHQCDVRLGKEPIQQAILCHAWRI